jgi:hypothetical protein
MIQYHKRNKQRGAPLLTDIFLPEKWENFLIEADKLRKKPLEIRFNENTFTASCLVSI